VKLFFLTTGEVTTASLVALALTDEAKHLALLPSASLALKKALGAKLW